MAILVRSDLAVGMSEWSAKHFTRMLTQKIQTADGCASLHFSPRDLNWRARRSMRGTSRVARLGLRVTASMYAMRHSSPCSGVRSARRPNNRSPVSTHALVIIGYVLVANRRADFASENIPSCFISRPCIQLISAACCEFELEIAQQFNTLRPVRHSSSLPLDPPYTLICSFRASKSS